MFITEDFLLDTGWSRKLYHEIAADLPIIDYHAHLPPADIAGRKTFRNIAELWLGRGNAGDHYKWRLMRASGVPERLITGDADDRDRFLAFCRVLPLAAGNPILHWSHLELKRIFGINTVINAETGPRLWDEVNEQLAGMDTWSFLTQARVEVSCTTDDPADDLAAHAALARSDLSTRVLPAYRPDKAMRIDADAFPAYLEQLGRTANVGIDSFASLVRALTARIDFFHDHGARASDHAVDVPLPTTIPDDATVERLFARRLAGETLTAEERSGYVAALLLHLGRAYARKGWTMCLHIGALRNTNSRGLAVRGPDTGYDAIAEMTIAAPLARLLDALDSENLLPKTMLFCLNPTMNAMLSVLTGCFQDGSVAGKLQFGPAWWFNDHKDGNLEQMRVLASHGVLGTFVGMVTDSRSFASFPRHDYFRRLLCRLLGRWVEDGEYPADLDALATIVRGVSHGNAKSYFGL
ncbi:D-glucoronate/D-galacturonate isomerase [Rhodovastum atsumiense]|uniref:Uronate isomerase n=1 Tax=Rhodovastum atsumiense TaxID=504468 RepID=A0A5M6IIN8_9PROT|nr:glucuronate isomerase [Rhodovastum atsumiense]KAA5608141.1 glucuronate isomerase [Rhodovastum atsumiense]CAH2599364.1 D-glucoronate/D-galacturonate isomerase [Rhodovastum atsumiense]